MNLSNYPNIQAAVNALGGIKKTLFNKKALTESEAKFASHSAYDLMMLEQELAYSSRKILDTIITPSAIISVNGHVLDIVWNRDIIWIYGFVTTNKMNGIPTNKQHEIRLLVRTGDTYSMGMVSTSGFSKKDVTTELLQQFAQITSQRYPGIFYGWSNELADAACYNLQALIEAVDTDNSKFNQNNIYNS